jgi:hypothetical protein
MNYMLMRVQQFRPFLKKLNFPHGHIYQVGFFVFLAISSAVGFNISNKY